MDRNKQFRVFEYIPFIRLVFVSGSVAMGTANESSDCDVLIGVMQGRIFLVRCFTALILELCGSRCSHTNNKNDTAKRAGKICLNHFVTPTAYRLSPPHTNSWRKLYQALIPIYGSDEEIKKFRDANIDWVGQYTMRNTAIVNKSKQNKIKRSLEWLLKGSIGNQLEYILKRLQIKRIRRRITQEGLGYKPRVVYTDDELEFHPDRRKFEI